MPLVYQPAYKKMLPTPRSSLLVVAIICVAYNCMNLVS